jgi:general secretion pathway protein J
MKAMATRRLRGFTLVELLVALFITAIMFAIGYGALDQALTGRKNVEAQANRMVSIQRALRMFEQDIGLLTPRPVRDAIGGAYLAPLVAGTGSSTGISTGNSASGGSGTAMSNLTLQSTALLTLTRAGWTNPAGVTRSELQRVFYTLEDGKLVRYTLPVLDAAGAVPAVRRELVDQVDALTFRYMDAGHHWQDTWSHPSTGSAQLASMRELPIAIEVTLVLKDWGSLVRVIEVAG